MGWPTMKRIDAWRGHLGAARDAVAIVVRTIAELEPVLVVAEVGEGRAAAGWIGDGVEVVELPMDDAWLRDTGPVVLTDADGGRAAVHFGFDAWGGRHDDYTLDAALGGALADHLGLAPERAPFVLEAGAVTATADGTVITTASCLLDPARNGAVDAATVEAWFADWLGAARVVWLPSGLADDRAGGHVTNLVAVGGDGRILLQTTTDASDADHHAAAAARSALADAGLEVVELDVLPHVACFDATVEVPYVNLHVGNAGVFVPLGGAAADGEMLDRIADCFPGRQVVGVPGTVLAYGGGGVRTLTCPIPAGSAD